MPDGDAGTCEEKEKGRPKWMRYRPETSLIPISSDQARLVGAPDRQV
jgi:hypothetical protein